VEVMNQKLHIKVGDVVKVLSGESRGQEGKLLVINKKKGRATVEGLNLVKNMLNQVLLIRKEESLKWRVEYIFQILWSFIKVKLQE